MTTESHRVANQPAREAVTEVIGAEKPTVEAAKEPSGRSNKNKKTQ